MAYVLTEITDGVAVLTLNDPEKRNAIHFAMNDELVDTVERLDNDPRVGAIVVTGAGKAFSAGAKLEDLLAAAEGGADSLTSIYRGFLRVAHSPLPTIAAVNGAAVGAGMNMALACDVIVAARRAKFDCRFLQIGIHPGGGHSWRLREKTSDQVARAMLLFGEVLDGERAAEVGLAWKCADDDQLLAECHTMAARSAACNEKLTRATKATIDAARDITTSLAAVEREVAPQAHSMQWPEFQELVTKLMGDISSG